MQASISTRVHSTVGGLLDGATRRTPRSSQPLSLKGLERSHASVHLRNLSFDSMQAGCFRLRSSHSATRVSGLQSGKGLYIAKTIPIGSHMLLRLQDHRGVNARLLEHSQNRSLVQLKQGFSSSADDRVNKRGARVSKCCALGEGVDEVASAEGSALREQGKEKEEVITQGWLEGNAFQIAFVSLCLATALVPVAPKFEFSGQLYMTIIASLTIYVGSHRSLKGQLPSKMTLQNSFAVPFFSSAVLFGFWCLLKYFPDLDLKVLLKSYLFLVGSVAVGSNVGEPLARLLPPLAAIKTSITFPKWLIQDDGEAVTSDVRATDVLAAAIGIVISVINVFPDAPYSVNNFIAICLVSEVLQTLSLGSFVTAAALLAGLLCYDVFWVFGSPSVIGDNVMVTVATSKSFMSSPMMLQFPVLNPGPSGRGFTILGLGDITVPGLLIALALRFDRFRNTNSNEETGEASTSSREGNSGWEWLDSIDDKTYFRTCLAAYCVGLGVTFVANSFSGAAQPALLYLVPAVLCGGSLAAVQRGEFRALLDYKDRAGTEEAIPEPIEVVDSDKLLK